jgi:hypothetical protein
MSIDLILENVIYHHSFILKEPCRGNKSSKPPSRVPTAATALTNNLGNIWNSPFDWLCKSYGNKYIKIWWKRALGGNDICPMRH